MNTRIDDFVLDGEKCTLEQYLAACESDEHLCAEVQRRLLAIRATKWLETNGGHSEYSRQSNTNDVPGETAQVSLEHFVQSLSELGMITEPEADSYRQTKMDASALANHLVGLKVLTPYQAKMVLVDSCELVSMGNYLIIDEIGSGGMGVVYLAIHRPMNRVVALKVMSPHLLVSESKMARFKREARIAGALAHPNVVTAFDADRQGDNLFLAMEYISGNHLGKLVETRKEISVLDAVNIVQQAAEGLAHAHDRQVIHRDIKPSNILIAVDGTAKIADLGLATIHSMPQKTNGTSRSNMSTTISSSIADGTLTECNELLGTLNFMAPEQADNPRAADERSDIYSLGCTFYYALTGVAPFVRSFPYAVINAHNNAPRPLPSKLRPDVDPAIDEFVQRMMAVNPADRFPTMEAVVSRLKQIRRLMNVSACNSISMNISDVRRKPKWILPRRIQPFTTRTRIALAALISLSAFASFAAVEKYDSRVMSSPTHLSLKDGGLVINVDGSEQKVFSINNYPATSLAASFRNKTRNRALTGHNLNQLLRLVGPSSAETVALEVKLHGGEKRTLSAVRSDSRKSRRDLLVKLNAKERRASRRSNGVLTSQNQLTVPEPVASASTFFVVLSFFSLLRRRIRLRR